MNLAVRRNRVEIKRCVVNRLLLRFEYRDGEARTVEPHVVGLNYGGAPAMLAWLRSGHSASGPTGGWRQYRLDGMTALEVLDEHFASPRPSFTAPQAEFAVVWRTIA